MHKQLWFRLVMSIHTAIIAYFWWTGSSSLFGSGFYGSLLAIGKLCGLILVTLALTQLLIMSRAPWIEQAFGLDTLARLHHKIGRYFGVFLIAHPLLIILSYSKFAETSFVQQYLSLLKSEDIPQASIALVLFLSIIVYSLLRVWKNWNFERWYYVHLAMYGAIILAFGHQLELGSDFLSSNFFTYYWYFAYASVACMVLYFRFTLPVLLYKKHAFRVTEVKAETHDVTSVSISGKKMDEYPIRPGQFMILRFLNKEFRWQAHPFSLSKYPDGKTLRISVKASGDFSSQISTLKPHTSVLIEGPYGIFTAERSTTNKVLLIAGGIGITPYRGILEDLGKAGKDVVLIYGNKTEADIALRSEIEELSQKYNIRTHHVLSNAEASSLQVTANSLVSFSAGFVKNDAIQHLVPDVATREIFLCGPPPMLNALLKSLPTLGVPKQKIYYEKFSL